jgi:gp16 family phage-associated protein
MSTPLRTKEQAREWLEEHGVSVMDVARKLNVPRWAVDDVLRGRGQYKRGARHTVAVALGMKAAPQGESPLNLVGPAAQTHTPPRRTRRSESAAREAGAS